MLTKTWLSSPAIYAKAAIAAVTVFFMGMSFFPVLANMHLVKEDIHPPYMLQKLSEIGLAMASPLFADAFLDWIIRNKINDSQWRVIGALLVPNILMIISCHEASSETELHVCIIYFGFITRYLSLVGNIMVHNFRHDFKKYIYLLIAFKSTVMVLLLISVFSNIFTPWVTELHIALGCIDFVLCILLIQSAREHANSASNDELFIIHATALIGVIMFEWIFLLSTSSTYHSLVRENSRPLFGMTLVGFAVMILAILMPNKLGVQIAEELNNRLERRKDFVRYVSHEVRSPLNAVCVGLHLLSQDIRLLTSSPDVLNVMDDILHSCSDAVSILDGLLMFSRLDSGREVLQQEQVQASPFVPNIFAGLSEEAKQAGVTLRVKYPNGLERFTLNIDKNKILVVVRNLIMSAVRMSPPHGAVDVTVSLAATWTDDSQSLSSSTNSTDEDRVMRLEVRDYGHGIPKDKQESLFVDSSLFTPVDYQTGLGAGLELWIAKEYVRMHGGRIGMISEGRKGMGCLFYVELLGEVECCGGKEDFEVDLEAKLSVNSPTVTLNDATARSTSGVELCSSRSIDISENQSSSDLLIEMEPQLQPQINDVNRAPPPALPASALVTKPHRSNSRISPGDVPSLGIKLGRSLVVDDVASNRKMLGRIIKPFFHEIQFAANGQVAVDMVRKVEMSAEDAPYNVIFMDCNMPVMDGIAATTEIRNLGYKGLVFGVTGNGLQEDVDRFTASGVNQVMIKPLNVEKFCSAMKGSRNHIYVGYLIGNAL
mmetsp:Transcript_14033/g.20983  ORF Transcript_14033/g.20983 Transcript_14033/m.20983 type:complete len:769 (+) Transcript_14033:170-2476(+)